MIALLMRTAEGRVLAALVMIMALLAAGLVMMIECTMYEGDERIVDD